MFFFTFQTALLISAVFIVLTIVIYIFIRELWIPSTKYHLCHLVFLVIAFIQMSWNYFNGANYMEPWICKTVASLICFSFLSASLWWNVISYKKWSNFRYDFGMHSFSSPNLVKFMKYLRNLRSTNRSDILYGKRYLRNSILYAIGIPSLLTIIGLIFDSFGTPPNYLQPEIGAETCFLEGLHSIKYFGLNKFLTFRQFQEVVASQS